MKSILDTQKYVCYRCGRYGPTERHHIFGGANRKLSDEDGLIVFLCHSCHNAPPFGAHFNKNTMEWLHRIGQEAWESMYGTRDEFMRRYGKNYL